MPASHNGTLVSNLGFSFLEATGDGSSDYIPVVKFCQDPGASS